MPAAASPARAEPAIVAVVVLNWNGWDDTRECLESLRQLGYPGLRVILVDNGSTDGSVARAKADYPEVELVENGANLGFAEGNNRGVARALAAGADYVMLLNNDTIVEPGFLEPLVAALQQDREIGFASPKIVYADEPGRAWFCGAEIDWRTGWVHHKDPDSDQAARAGLVPTPSATGCCLIARREVWERVGLLDPRFFLIWEDADWSVRATRAGYGGVVVADSRIRHKVSASFERGLRGVGTFYFVRNGLLFIRKHAPRPVATSLRFALEWVVRHSVREALRRERTWRVETAMRIAGVIAYLSGRFGPAPGFAGRLAGRLHRASR